MCSSKSQRDLQQLPSHLLSCRVITRTQSLPSSLENYHCAASTCVEKRDLVCLTHSKQPLPSIPPRILPKHDAHETQRDDTFWDWDVHKLSGLPPLFPIERTHEVIKDSSPEKISHNISKLLQEESISVRYDNEHVSSEQGDPNFY